MDIPHVARDTICRIGYDQPESGFNGHTCAVLTAIDEQSGDIAMGVNSSFDEADTLGAGDQGMMFGFACNETPELMPAPITYAQQLAMKLSAVCASPAMLDWLRPDGKSQVSVQYGEDGSVGAHRYRRRFHPACRQRPDQRPARGRHRAWSSARPLPARLIDEDTKFYVNPTGRFVMGGPAGDSGLTGRKIIVDTYGGYAAHGGGAFSGKDPTKVDRSAAYMARYVAKNLVAAGLADQVPDRAGLCHRRCPSRLRPCRHLRNGPPARRPPE